jgi:hypothetical protein
MHSAWLPFDIKNGNFSYQLSIDAPKDFVVTGNGSVTVVDNKTYQRWSINSVMKQFDVPLLVGKKLQTQAYSFEGNAIEISHFGLSSDKIDALAKDVGQILELFNDKFGSTSNRGGNFRFIFVPRNDGPSFSRKGLAVISAGRSDAGTYSTIAHEIGHFWWNKGDSSSWQDWLSESFAEYSALLAYQSKYSVEEYNQKLEKYKKYSKGTVPIWDIDRQSEAAYVSIYIKGSLIMQALRQRLGDKIFFKFLQTLNQTEKYRTVDLLSILNNISSEQQANWLEQALKK